MLSEIYVEALLVDEELADQVFEACEAGEFDDQTAWLAWTLITLNGKQSENLLLRLVEKNDKAKPASRGWRRGT